jgi:hypothetical protein
VSHFILKLLVLFSVARAMRNVITGMAGLSSGQIECGVKFTVHHCVLGYGGESCGKDPCIVPDGPETKWERFSDDGLSYDGFLIADVDGSRLQQHTCGNVHLVSGEFVWATDEERRLYEEGLRLRREREDACPACRADREYEAVERDFDCRFGIITTKKHTVVCGH